MKLKTDSDILDVGDFALRKDLLPSLADDVYKKQGVLRDHPYIGFQISKLRSIGALTKEYVIWGTEPRWPRRLPMNEIFSKPLPLP
jgi:hypothetical protein